MRGVVGRVQQRSRSTWVSGWAFDKARLRPADEVVVFVDGEADHLGHAVVSRSDLVEGFKSPSLYQAGFDLILPGYIFDRDPAPVVRCFRHFVDRGGVGAALSPSVRGWGSGIALGESLKLQTSLRNGKELRLLADPPLLHT